jgi:hypothetical protein
LQAAFQLRPVVGMNLMRTVSYDLVLTVDGGATASGNELIVNKNCNFCIQPCSASQPLGGVLTVKLRHSE